MHVLKPIWPLLVLPLIVSALDESSLKEKKCSEIETPVDLKWLSTVKAWYVPLWNKLDRARTASDILEKAVADLSQSDMSQPSCILFKSTNWVYGFNTKIKFDDITGDATSLSFKAPWKGAKSAKFSYRLTDNRSYILGVNCWEDGESTWAVLSTKPTLSADAKERIMNYVTALGFKEDMTVEENYEKCGIDAIMDVKDEL